MKTLSYFLVYYLSAPVLISVKLPERRSLMQIAAANPLKIASTSFANNIPKLFRNLCFLHVPINSLTRDPLKNYKRKTTTRKFIMHCTWCFCTHFVSVNYHLLLNFSVQSDLVLICSYANLIGIITCFRKQLFTNVSSLFIYSQLFLTSNQG